MLNKFAIISGATGFVGQDLCRILAAKECSVCKLVRKTLWQDTAGAGENFLYDVTNADDVLRMVQKNTSYLRGSTFFHLAGKAHALAELNTDPFEYFKVNAEGTRNALNLARQLGCRRFVLASTVKVIGEGQSEEQSEKEICAPETPYGQSKLEAEKILFSECGYVEPVALRLSMVYGGKERGNMTRMVDAVRRNRFPPFPETGNRRSLVHIDDVVEAFILAAEHPKAAGETYIVTDGNLYSTREIYMTIRRALGCGNPVFTPPLSLFKAVAKVGDVLGKIAGRRMPLDSDSLEKLTGSAAFSCEKFKKLGFSPKVRLEEGIRRMVSEF